MFINLLRYQPGPLVFPATSPFDEVEGFSGVPGYDTIVAEDPLDEPVLLPVPAPYTAGPPLTYAGVASATVPPPVVPETPATGPETMTEPPDVAALAPPGAEVLLVVILPLTPPETAGAELALYVSKSEGFVADF